MSVGGQPGNKNAAKSRLFEQALIREIKQRDLKDGEGETLRKIAAALLDEAATSLKAKTELRDTLDGKPAQMIVGDSDNPIEVISRVERVIVNSKD